LKHPDASSGKVWSFSKRTTSFLPFLSKMSKYSPNTVWSLVFGYNTARGQILDGILVSKTPSVSWASGEKHGVQDGSIHHKIMRYLESQPNKRAKVADIAAFVPQVGNKAEHYLREMEKQHFCGVVPV